MLRDVADSSFYIFFYTDIQTPKSLYLILKHYNFIIGKQIKKEISQYILKDDAIKNLVSDVTIQMDYIRLLKDFYNFLIKIHPEIKSSIDDGEWEAIGISYLLHEQNELRHIIIDDKKARNFIQNRLTTLLPYLQWTVQFLFTACVKDNKISKDLVLDICYRIREEITKGRSPLFITSDHWQKNVEPNIKKMEGD